MIDIFAVMPNHRETPPPLQAEYPVLMASKLDKEDLKKILEDTKELVKIIMEEVGK